ncbi:MAG: ComF family protein [Armatimonadota bacterium]|nr:ComF family protein [Armatimonadota bacterium]
MWAGLVDLLYPPICAACNSPGEHLCERCLLQSRRIQPPVCACCGSPVPPTGWGRAAVHTRDGRCEACRRHPPAYERARSVFVYEGPIREAIHALKYHGRRAAAAPLGLLLAQHASADLTQGVESVVPVPLHPSRLATRGFNQAELLARPLAARLGVPCLTHAVRRSHHERAQAELDAAARHASVRDAFCPGPAHVGTRVVLVDDVFSTGATAEACAAALKRAGASAVAVLTVARALLRGQAAMRDAREADAQRC